MTSGKQALLERVRREGPVLELEDGAIGIFDPTLAVRIDNANSAALHLPPSPQDVVAGRHFAPVPWKDVRQVLLARGSRLSRGPALQALHADMRRRLLAAGSRPVDLGRLVAGATTAPLIGCIIAGLDRATLDHLAAAQDARLDRQLRIAARPENLPMRMAHRWRELRDGRRLARAVRKRAARALDDEVDFAGALIAMQDRLGQARVNYLVQSLLIAASTAPATIAACIAQTLATRPELRGAIRAEMRALAPGALYEESARSRLPATTAFIREALRLWTFPMIAGRRANERHDLGHHGNGDIRIEKDAPYVLSSYVAHRCPMRWPDPDRFDPTRFAGPDAGYDRTAYVPFGFGGRTCVAAGLGEAQLRLVCALLADEFELVCDDPAGSRIEIGAVAFPTGFTGRIVPRARPFTD